MRSAKLLRDAEQTTEPWQGWANPNTIFFLLLHSCELGLKAIGFARGTLGSHKRSHDLNALLKSVTNKADFERCRAVVNTARAQKMKRIKDRFSDGSSEHALAAIAIETERLHIDRKTIHEAFLTLGALGQSKLHRLEFGEEVNDWCHAARYPRHGTIQYPDFDICVCICQEILDVARQTVEAHRLSENEKAGEG